MRKNLTVFSPAKINLHLEIQAKREDGYHDLISLFQIIDFYDKIIIGSLKNNKKCLIKSDFQISLQDNLIFKAIEAFWQKSGYRHGFEIEVEKKIPAGAGLGGGSSNAATALKAANCLAGNPLSSNDLAVLGSKIGCDVPFFCKARTALITGRGDRVEPFVGRDDYCVLLSVPDIHIPTESAYSWHDRNLRESRGKQTSKSKASKVNILLSKDKIIEEYQKKPPSSWRFFNSFLSVATNRYSEIEERLTIIRRHGALFAGLSGSGSAVFGLFSEPADAQAAQIILKKQGGKTGIFKPII